MEAKHTPGPWRAMPDGAIQRDAPMPMGGAVVAYTRHAAIATQAANARLIAAAPDMLTALQTIALHIPSLDAQGVRELCDAAIAQATGKE